MQQSIFQQAPDVQGFKDLVAADDLFEEGHVYIARAPGRLDLMGGIADYSGSLVLELPIANATFAGWQGREDNQLRIKSVGKGIEARYFEIDLRQLLKMDYSEARDWFASRPSDHWASYVAGCYLVAARELGCGFKSGANILVSSSVPEGKGVSSSAALEVASMRAIKAGQNAEISGSILGTMCQKVENLVAGAPCGIMDQMTSACGEMGKLFAMVCQPARVLSHASLPADLGVWGIDSGVRHAVGGSDYGTVRCAAFMGYTIIASVAGLRISKADGKVQIEDSRWNGYLANITPTEFEKDFARHLPESTSGEDFLKEYGGITDTVTSVNPSHRYPVLAATSHPVFENERVRRFYEMIPLGASKGPELGSLMYASHDSYSSCGLGSAATDALVEMVKQSSPALYGAKITGGGSGGTVAVLGHKDAAVEVLELAHKFAPDALVISGSSPGAAQFGVVSMYRKAKK